MSRIVTGYVCLLLAAPPAVAQTGKTYKEGEYEIYSETAKALAAGNFTGAIANLDRWSAKYRDSSFAGDRAALYVHAYHGAKQYAKALDAAATIVTEALPSDPASAVRLLYAVATAVQYLPDATARQLETATAAARLLENYDKIPSGVTPEAWSKARSDLQATARATLLYIALLPITKAMKEKDCATADTMANKAVNQFPESAQVSWYLASANVCLSNSDPQRVSNALYGFARAAALDPVAGMVDPKWQQSTVEPYLRKIYTQYHGADDEGLAQLKMLALRSPLPPPGFTVKSAAEIAIEKQMKFESTHPEIALWIKIRNALATDGYFDSELKDVTVTGLAGVLVEARPACRPSELLIAVRSPDSAQLPAPEIRLKLSRPLQGKAELSLELRWEGVATAFTKKPFLLTMEVDPAKLQGISTTPCAPPVKKSGSKTAKNSENPRKKRNVIPVDRLLESYCEPANKPRHDDKRSAMGGRCRSRPQRGWQLLLLCQNHRRLLPPLMRRPPGAPGKRPIPHNGGRGRQSGLPSVQALQAGPLAHRLHCYSMLDRYGSRRRYRTRNLRNPAWRQPRVAQPRT
jgi:hypothetical protein